jgi:pSer/pThr/pTyr-binding forkhead associated (FHA) protein
VDEGKLASQALSGSSEAQSGNNAKDAELKGRLRNPVTNRLDLGSSLNDDEDAISRMAKRFRGPGARLSQADEEPSLDDQQSDDADLSSEELQGFLLDALDGADEPAADYELEEFDDVADTVEPARNPLPGVDATDRMVEPEAAPPAEAPGAATQGIVCTSCRASNPPGMRFCVQCGGSLKAAISTSAGSQQQTQRQPPPPSAAAKQENPWDIHLISINEDGSDGISIALEFLETTLGCDGDTRFPTDAFLSPKHARLHIEDGELFIEDLYSLNGTFLKLSAEIRLTPGDSFLMGRQVLRFERFEQSITPKTKSADGTRYMGSPAPGGNFKVLQIGIGNVVQNVYCLPESGAVLGREKGDIIFPHDKFMSSRHAQIYTGEDGHCYLVDLNSSNGTWTKIWEKTRLRLGDYIFMGQQLFRVHIGRG